MENEGFAWEAIETTKKTMVLRGNVENTRKTQVFVGTNGKRNEHIGFAKEPMENVWKT